MIDTLVITRNGKQMLERYSGQNLDEYDHDLEIDHEKLATEWYNDKIRKFHFMDTITWDEVVEYLRNEFDVEF